MKVIRYTKYEGGEWIDVTGELEEGEVFELPLLKHPRKGYLWGYIHSFIREDGRRFDAFNDAFRIGRTVDSDIKTSI